MKKIISAVSTLVITLSTSVALAKSSLKYENPRIFAPLKGSNATAGYVDIKNTTDKEVEVSLKSVEKFKAFETHETVHEDGKMAMKKVDSFKIAPNETLELKPGGRHLMLFDPTTTIKEGSVLNVVFTVNGKTETLKFKVIARQAQTEASHH